MSNVRDAAITSAPQPQCQFFVVRKKRLCRMTVRPGRQYCGEHEPQPLIADQETDKRVPCPNDPKHTCYVSKLEKHLTKCNARQMEDPPYIIRNINACEDEDTSPRIPLKDVSLETLQRVIDKINSLYEKYVKSTISTYNPPSEYHPAVAPCIAQEDRTDSSRRHLRQASRIMQLMEEEGLVGDNTCLVELGAGKGMLSYYMCRAWCEGGSRVLCVDRASLRHKRDNRAAGRASRLRADLRHLALARAPPARDAAALVGVAKHLCGVATDYALRCMCACGERAHGVLVATCCHHRCEPAAYVGRAPLQALGVTRDDLNVMFGVVSWATCGDGRGRDARRAAAARASETEASIQPTELNDKEETDPNVLISEANSERNEALNMNIQEIKTTDGSNVRFQQLPAHAREQVGRRAKALIDYGRVEYLRGQGLEARLCYYVPPAESPENLCIVGKRRVQ